MTGRLLVALQFIFLTLLMWPWSAASFSAAGSILIVSGAGLGLWTLAFNRIGNFNIHPAPKADAVFITGGPYRYIRHPMYTALMIACAGIVCWYGTWQKAACWLALAGVLYAKSRVEEVALKRAFPDYEAYVQRTQRFIPYIF
jgi:protein-S-isoprenylcysteine O-methyltransferase Ste14